LAEAKRLLCGDGQREHPVGSLAATATVQQEMHRGIDLDTMLDRTADG
jgi:hypothetical protein